MIRPNLIALLTLLATGPLSVACAPSICAPVKKIVKADVVVAPVAVAAVAYVPAYGATYQANQADEVNGELLRQLLEVMRRIEAKLDRQPPATAIAPVALDAGKLMGARCAGCHTASVAKSKGGELVLVEDSGKLPPFSVGEQRIIKRAVESGTMPPKTAGPPLSTAEKASLLEFMFPKTPKE